LQQDKKRREPRVQQLSRLNYIYLFFFFFLTQNVSIISGREHSVGADGEAQGYSQQALAQLVDPQQKGMSCHRGRNLTVVFVEYFVVCVCVYVSSVLITALCWLDNINLLGIRCQLVPVNPKKSPW